MTCNASFYTRRGEVHAVRDVSFSLRQGETLALVGESGSGKTATAMSILRMLPGTGRITSGQIVFEGEDLLGLSADGRWRASAAATSASSRRTRPRR